MKARDGAGASGEPDRRAAVRGPEWSFAQVLLAAVWLGATAGLTEAVYSVVTHRLAESVRVDFFSHGWGDLWMAPLVSAAISVAVAAAAFGALRLLRRRVSPDRLTLALVTTLVCYALARRVVGGVHPAASLVLSIGAALQISRLAVARSASVCRFMARSLALGVTVVTVCSLGVHIGRHVGERNELAALPEASPGSPNVLMIVLDTVRARSLSLYGYARNTSPQLDRLATRGVVFENAMTATSWTLPSHASMLTGRWAHELSTDWYAPLDATHPTLSEWFGARGYATCAVVANIGYCGEDFGLQRGFAHFDARPNGAEFVIGSCWLGRQVLRQYQRRVRRNHQQLLRVLGSEVRTEFVDWVASRAARDPGRPYFALLNLYDAHEPYLPPAPWDEKYGRRGARYWFARSGATYSAEEEQDFVDTYDNSVSYVDHELGALLAELERAGALANTILVVTSDHGEEFNEHGVWQHGQSLYTPSLRVPLVMVWPGRIPAGRRVASPVALRSLPATLTKLVSGEGAPEFPSNSLEHLWNTTAGSAVRSPDPIFATLSRRDHLPSSSPAGRGNMQSVIVDGLRYIRIEGGEEELYDIAIDPGETRDLSTDPHERERLERLRRLLDEQMRHPADGASERPR